VVGITSATARIAILSHEHIRSMVGKVALLWRSEVGGVPNGGSFGKAETVHHQLLEAEPPQISLVDALGYENLPAIFKTDETTVK